MQVKIGIIGAGVMGRGVAQRFAQNGYSVLLLDKSADILTKAKDELTRQLKMASMFNKTISVDDVMGRISFICDYSELNDADFIIENVNENEEIKKDVYTELEKVCKNECIYMVNTSCIPITLIGSFTARPDKVIGVHFMNPVPLKNFSEMIRGIYTSEGTITEVTSLLSDIGIKTEIINDSAGFVSNRISHLYMNEAAYLVYEGVATAKQIDTIFENGFGHKMGPLQTADLIGLDTVMDSLEVLYKEYQDPKFRVCPLLKQLVYAGKLGRKSGHGFFDYI